MTRRRLVARAGCALLVLGAAYLRDPPWLGQITSGLRTWETDRRHGERFRWTTGRASFFVPREARVMTLPLPRKTTNRRFRRVDLHVSRTLAGDFMLGVQTGEIELDQTR